MPIRLTVRTRGGDRAKREFESRAKARSQGDLLEYGYIADRFISDDVPLAQAAFKAEMSGRPFMRQANALVATDISEGITDLVNEDATGIRDDARASIGEVGVEEIKRSAVRHGYIEGEGRRMAVDPKWR